MSKDVGVNFGIYWCHGASGLSPTGGNLVKKLSPLSCMENCGFLILLHNWLISGGIELIFFLITSYKEFLMMAGLISHFSEMTIWTMEGKKKSPQGRDLVFSWVEVTACACCFWLLVENPVLGPSGSKNVKYERLGHTAVSKHRLSQWIWCFELNHGKKIFFMTPGGLPRSILCGILSFSSKKAPFLPSQGQGQGHDFFSTTWPRSPFISEGIDTKLD